MSPAPARALAAVLCCLALAVPRSPVRAQGACDGCYDFNERCRRAYDLLFALRLDEGLALLETEKRLNPGNRMPWFLANYADFFTCYITEDPAQFAAREPNKALRLDALRQGTGSSPWARYAEAELHLQWALARLKFEQYLAAFREIRKAYKLLEENRRRFPDFRPTYKSLGLLHAIIGAIPDQYQWGARIVGLDGDIGQGLAELDALLAWAREDGDYAFEQEALVYRALMALYLDNDPEGAWAYSAEGLALEGHLLNHFVAASVAMRTGRNDEAIRLLEAAPRGPGYLDFPYLDFMLGLARLRRLDADADRPLRRFLDDFGGANYVREAWQKLGWHELVRGNEAGYRRAMDGCLAHGTSVIDDDKQAEAEARRGVPPHPALLRARLLFDGGYYARALRELEGRSVDDFDRPEERVEFSYRAGRIYDEAGLPDKAIPYYEATLVRGAGLPLYFAANAALHLGQIHEEAGRVADAEAAYRRCLQLKDHAYASSISSKAKAGLNRLR